MLNLTLYIIKNVLNGYLLRILKMSLILPEAVMVKFFLLDGLRVISILGILKIKDGKG
ncbi:hypothetical protein GLOIN_2v1507537 [Rhizophagus irregularis DAOM 181602=DAOM 197198]|uniref:Uncharacterized protein n=1 Tax=Rhizophagus irregularis (strain DAOM 181602 / DAOM 197198 / MUCL 43194) TaxID=747089 RepID=A0A2P4QUU1_RHIID|nr:hypothetical protein GLOIN_2v1507537 [Rhizophagus irregularis DAOM 181602=DAOM 197198]POG81397.1 hypothetical protein GLOIN_2v1507537 [Rhizophagus irregularis DAOM 181602=DAOM 197198]|eukprot:XP_025188263.1 hypothetical protein GLOIN_2v1507537 [Rhizophagus irregularis DAOM 181602=DAOM 197198]